MPEVTESVAKVDVESTEKVDCVKSTNSATNGTSENSVSSSSPEKKSPDKNEAEVLLAQGKRHLFIKDYPNAVGTLGDACAKLDEMYGYLADECADAYFCYGRALLELAREDSNVLGTEPEKEDGEEEESDEGEEEKDKLDKDGTTAEKLEKDETVSKEIDDDEENESKDNETPADETIDTTKEVNEEDEDKDNVDNLQLAWEVFELAKKIFERQNAKEKLADTYLYLGEVQLESENYNGAVDDMKRCIEVQKEILPPDHREIAETYFQLGVAYSLSNEFDLAIINYKTSCEILENRIRNLEENGYPKEETEKNPSYSVEKEVSEIKALLPEIKAKVADMEDFKQETLKRVMASFSVQPQSSDGAGPSSSSGQPAAPTPSTNGSPSKPANNISHLVRKKRKPEEEAATESTVKKSCTNEVKK